MSHLTADDLVLWLSPWSHTLAASLLVFARIIGMLLVGPLLGQAILPWRARIGLAVTLSILMTPLLRNIESWELAMSLVPALAAELGLGFLLGCGTCLIFWAVPLAGQLLDQQSRLADGEDSALNGSPGARWLLLSTAACFLLCSPINGHIRLVMSLAENIQTWPLGQACSWLSADFAANLLQQSFDMSLRVAAPALSAMLLTNFALGLLGATGATGLSASISNAIRPLVAGIVLIACLFGANQSAADFVRDGFSANFTIQQSPVESLNGIVR